MQQAAQIVNLPNAVSGTPQQQLLQLFDRIATWKMADATNHFAVEDDALDSPGPWGQ